MTAIKPGDIQKRYLAALQNHCRQAPGENDMESAQLLGDQAVSLGLTTLELAAIHREALSSMESKRNPSQELASMTKLATDFFAATLLPIEATHRPALKASSNLERLNANLARITRELDESTRDLEQGVAERKTAEQALKISEELSAKVLGKSQDMYSEVQDLARKILGANEEERRLLSQQLQDEIAQALLGIHVRLLVLRRVVATNSETFRKEVDLTQRLVRETVNTINRTLRDFENPHES